MQRMRRRGRNPGIAASRRQTQFGQLRLVIAVNQVMRHSRMSGLLLEKCFQHGRRFLPVGECSVAVLFRRQQRKRVKCRCLEIAGVTLIDALHRQ